MRGYLKSTNGLYQLSQKTTTVGREGCDLIIQSATVDRQHAVIDIDELGESYVLQDLNTTYGTYVNDCRIENAAIRLLSGDVIRFGNSNILHEFVASSEPALTCPPVHRQSAWQPLTLITDREHHPVSALPQLRSYVATTTQTFSNSPTVAVPQPKPPASVRSRPLSAGSRHRQVIDRTGAVPLASVTGPGARPVGGWVHGGPGLLRSSSSTDLRNIQDQEERRVAWLHEEVQRLSSYEKDCQNKDEIIGQLYREIDALQRRQLSYTHHEHSDAPRLSVLENELIAKAQEVDQLKYQIQQVRVLQNNPNTSELVHLKTMLEKLQQEHNKATSQNSESKNILAKKDEELEQLRKEIDSFKQVIREKDVLLNQKIEDSASQERQLGDLQLRLNNAVAEVDSHGSVVNGLKHKVDQLESALVSAREAHDQVLHELELHKGSYQDMDSAKAELHNELTLIAGKLAAFRLQVKQAICYVSDNSLADNEDDDDDVIQVIKHIVSERTSFRAKVQKLKDKVSTLKKLSESVHQTNLVHLGLCKEATNYLSTTGLLCRELKLEIAALRQKSDSDEFISLFIQLLEIMSSWEFDIESALENCNIDVQNSPDAPSVHIQSLRNRLDQSQLQISQLNDNLNIMKQEHSRELDAIRRDLQEDYDLRLREAIAANEQRQSDAVTAAVVAECAKNDSTHQLHQAQIRTLEAELDQLKQFQETAESELHSQLVDMQSAVESYRQTEDSLKQKLSTSEAERLELSSRIELEVMEVTTRLTREKKLYEEQISEHARTICALEDQLDKITSRAKEYQSEISTLHATVEELSTRQRQSSPQPIHRKLIMQPVQSSIDVAALGQLQRDNVDLKRQLHDQNDIIISLRRDLAGATARLSDITGEVSERQKMELEQKSVKIEQQQLELTELRQQLAKLSEIVDKQTAEVKQLNAEASKSKASITKYKNKLNEKEAQLKQSEHGLLKVKKDTSTKLSVAEDEGRIQAELALAGAQCRGERHDQVITRQRDALVELRARIRVLESGNLPVMTQDEALQELLLLRHQMAELRSGPSSDSLALVPFPTTHLGGNVPLDMSPAELSEAFELSENLYMSLVRALGSVLELENLTRMRSMAHVAREDRRVLAVEREQELERIIGVVRLLKERIERKDELLQGYERDLAKLRYAEDLTELTSGQKDSLVADLRKKAEEVECLRESLAKAKERLEQEKRLNLAIKQKKTFHLENERVTQANGWPKHHCVSDGHSSSVPGKKPTQNEKLKRKNYEIRLLQDELRSRRSDISHHRRVTTGVDTREIGLQD